MKRLGSIVLATALAIGTISGCKPPHDVHPPEPPKSPHLPGHDPVPLPGGELGAAGEHAAQEADSDPIEYEMICFAYEEFYDPSTFEFRLPSEDEFFLDVFEKVRPKSEEEQIAGQVEDAYGLVQNVSGFEMQALAQRLAC